MNKKNDLTIHHPHDKFFKSVFGRKKEAQELLKKHLPPEVLAKINLKNIEIVKSAFIKDDLQERYSDLVIKTNIDGKEGYIYALVEHQSTPDSKIFFRLIEYNNLLMQHHLKAGNQTVPSIFNIVLYTGAEKYNIPTDFIEMADSPSTFAFPIKYKLIDLRRISDETLINNGSIALAELVLKHSAERRFCQWVERNLKIFRMLVLAIDYRVEFFYYINEVENDGGCDIQEKMIKFVPELKEEIMTVATRLRREGRKEGMTLGRQDTLKDLLAKGILTKEQVAKLLKEK